MIILPAIDISGGECVRLFKGDFKTVEKVAENALSTAQAFEAAGAVWIHMVDLDGAKNGKMVNSELFLEISRKTGLKVELGGGIRNMETVEYYLKNGISRVILGSAALRNPEFVRAAVSRYGDQIAVGIDAKGGLVSVEGWLEDSQIGFIEFAKEMESIGVSCLIYTDISKDGTLEGPNLKHMEELHASVSCNIIASGGVASIHDITELKNLGLYGAICGKSLYKGTLDLAEAIAVAKT